MSNIPAGWYLALLFIIGAGVALYFKRSTSKGYAEKLADYQSAIAQYNEMSDVQKARYRQPVEPERSGGIPFGVIAIVGFVLAAVCFLQAFVYVVPARNVAIPTEFGNVRKPLQSGVHIGSPFLKLNNWELTLQESSMIGSTDGDKKEPDSIDVRGSDNGVLFVDTTITYKVDAAQADKLYADFKTLPVVRDRVIRPAVRSVMRNVFTQFTSTDGVAKERTSIEAQVTAGVNEELSKYGIKVDAIRIRSITPAPDVDAAIKAKLAAVQEAEKAIITQGQQVTEAETRKQVAQRDAEAKITAANGDATAVKVAADAKAYENEKLTQSITPELVEYIKAQALAKANTIYVPSNVTPIIGLPSPSTTTGK